MTQCELLSRIVSQRVQRSRMSHCGFSAVDYILFGVGMGPKNCFQYSVCS